MRHGPSRCAIYTRQSSSINTGLASCQVQFDACRSFLEAHRDNGWMWIGERFDDEGRSGATLDRPGQEPKNGFSQPQPHPKSPATENPGLSPEQIRYKIFRTFW